MSTTSLAGLIRKTTLAALVTLVLLATVVVSSSASPSAAVQDPERNATTPTGWHFWVGQTRAQIDSSRTRRESESWTSTSTRSVPVRFSAVLVRNTGTYARIGGWSYGSEGAVTNKIKATKGRLIDLEPFTSQGKRRFAYVWVKNSGRLRQGLALELRPPVKGVIKEINKYKVRLIDLSTYVVDGKRRYSYIGIAIRASTRRRGGGTSTSLRSSSSRRRRRTVLD